VLTNCTVTPCRTPSTCDSSSGRPGSFDSASIDAGGIGFPSITAAFTAGF
jgi:hypothetical protein